MAPITVEVGNGLASWSYDDVTLAAGVHEIERPPAQLEQAIRDAAAAGVGVRVLEEG
jgi:hypothetical protein